MSATTDIDSQTLRAYRETEYRVAGEPPFIMRIGEPCPALASLHASLGVACSAFVTACNPHSQRLSPAENTARQEELAGWLKTRDMPSLRGWGAHPDGNWPAEASFLVPGLALETACELGRNFEQNAVVWTDSSSIPELILLR